MDAVSAYPEIDEAIATGDIVTLHRLSRDPLAMNSVYGKGHRRATLPKWGGKHGSLVRGSVRWNGQGYEVIYSYLLGYSTTAKNTETFSWWFLAIGAYREHDRTVRERRELEQFRNSERAGVAQ